MSTLPDGTMATGMTPEDRSVVDGFLRDITRMHVHRSELGEARKKPLLLLLVLSMVKRGVLHENRIRFVDVEHHLADLITRYGGRPTESGPKPEQPFCHLRTSAFWELIVPGGLPTSNRKTLPKRVLSSPEAFAQLQPTLFAVLQRNRAAIDEVMETILQRWWSKDEGLALRADLHLN
jgi:predicted restriction endonuclease